MVRRQKPIPMKSAPIYRPNHIKPDRSGERETENSVMDSQQVERHEATASQARRACLVEGCTCKDARIVSHRRAAFFSAWARDHGETANRVIKADPAWSLIFNPLPAA
jgi:hypothetical protein